MSLKFIEYNVCLHNMLRVPLKITQKPILNIIKKIYKREKRRFKNGNIFQGYNEDTINIIYFLSYMK